MAEVSAAHKMVTAAALSAHTAFPRRSVTNVSFGDTSLRLTFSRPKPPTPEPAWKAFAAHLFSDAGDGGYALSMSPEISGDAASEILTLRGAPLERLCAALESAILQTAGAAAYPDVHASADGVTYDAITEYQALDAVPARFAAIFGVQTPAVGPAAGEIQIPNLTGLGDAGEESTDRKFVAPASKDRAATRPKW